MELRTSQTMQKITIEGNRAFIPSPIPSKLFVVSGRLEGSKNYRKDGSGFAFEPTHTNLKLLREALPDLEIDDRREEVARFNLGMPTTPEILANGTGSVAGLDRPTYRSKTTPYGDFQTRATAKCLAYDFCALFMEQGTGKSKVAIDVSGTRWCAGQITGVLVIAFNGVHEQWINEAFPDHLGEMVPWRGYAYRVGRKMPDWIYWKDKLAVFTISFDAARTKDGYAAIEAFLTLHAGHVNGIVDEGQRISNPDTKSSQAIFNLAPYCQYRMDLTGTPIVKDLTDIWSQFKFLDESIIGYKYKATFRSRFSVMHPKIRGVVVGTKNERQFYEIVAPYIFRVTKDEELDLPPKVYDKVEFELHPEQRKIYDDLKRKFLADLDGGKVSTIKNALVLVTRLQQVTCGYVAIDKDNPEAPQEYQLLPNPRMDVLKRVLKARALGKSIVWARFTHDIGLMKREFNNGVSYFGGDGKDERIENKRAFIEDKDITYLFSNPAAGGTGIDGLQKVARTAIYYSNSYNSVHRWQSEDRTHRIGMGETCTYIDLIAKNTVDRKILANLKKKKDLSNFVLDDIRQMLADEPNANE